MASSVLTLIYKLNGTGGVGVIIHATSNLLKLAMRFIEAIIMVVSYLHFIKSIAYLLNIEEIFR